MIRRLLDRVPFSVIWWADDHLNHAIGSHCLSRRYCDYTDNRAMQTALEDEELPVVDCGDFTLWVIRDVLWRLYR